MERISALMYAMFSFLHATSGGVEGENWGDPKPPTGAAAPVNPAGKRARSRLWAAVPVNSAGKRVRVRI
jgi:hypothetical protein